MTPSAIETDTVRIGDIGTCEGYVSGGLKILAAVKRFMLRWTLALEQQLLSLLGDAGATYR